nr:MAG TPA: hypothetical protein [Caudoviricetes sp.]DAU59338.1 MAG TPA: hypothetical protein [Crassvirales sp.]
MRLLPLKTHSYSLFSLLQRRAVSPLCNCYRLIGGSYYTTTLLQFM